MTAPLSVLQITDTHLKAPAPSGPSPTLLGVDTAASLAAVLEQALGERAPDAVIASGDLAHDPEPATYRHFLDVVRGRYGGPILYLPGNHDLTAPLAAVLGDAPSLRLGGWEIVGFDTHEDHQTEARFGSDRRADLAARLAATDADHVLLACHHHLLPVDCPWLDKDCVPNGREVLESCAAGTANGVDGAGAGTARAPSRVRGLVFGHVHQHVEAAVGGMSVLGTPSTCFQFEPRSPRFAIDRSADTGRPGYRWLTLHANGAIETGVGRVRGYHLNIDYSDRS